MYLFTVNTKHSVSRLKEKNRKEFSPISGSHSSICQSKGEGALNIFLRLFWHWTFYDIRGNLWNTCTTWNIVMSTWLEFVTHFHKQKSSQSFKQTAPFSLFLITFSGTGLTIYKNHIYKVFLNINTILTNVILR